MLRVHPRHDGRPVDPRGHGQFLGGADGHTGQDDRRPVAVAAAGGRRGRRHGRASSPDGLLGDHRHSYVQRHRHHQLRHRGSTWPTAVGASSFGYGVRRQRDRHQRQVTAASTTAAALQHGAASERHHVVGDGDRLEQPARHDGATGGSSAPRHLARAGRHLVIRQRHLPASTTSTNGDGAFLQLTGDRRRRPAGAHHRHTTTRRPPGAPGGGRPSGRETPRRARRRRRGDGRAAQRPPGGRRGHPRRQRLQQRHPRGVRQLLRPVVGGPTSRGPPRPATTTTDRGRPATSATLGRPPATPPRATTATTSARGTWWPRTRTAGVVSCAAGAPRSGGCGPISRPPTACTRPTGTTPASRRAPSRLLDRRGSPLWQALYDANADRRPPGATTNYTTVRADERHRVGRPPGAVRSVRGGELGGGGHSHFGTPGCLPARCATARPWGVLR